MLQADYRLEKAQVARSFAQAASSYDAHASLQRSIADSLLQGLEKDLHVKRVLDLGSGTGYATTLLQKLFPQAEIISLDIAEAMLLYARQQHEDESNSGIFVCADAESLPFSANSFDLVFSSLAIQWCQNTAVLFTELNRVLMPEGRLTIATFGPGTLQELEHAWQQIDAAVHVNHFFSESELNTLLKVSGFANATVKAENRLSYYPTLEVLAKELKSIGARNMNAGRGRGLNGRKKIQKLKQAFELNADQQQGIPVTYCVHYLNARTKA